MKITIWFETLLRDLRMVLRLLRTRPVFAATVIVTLALGVGVNTAVFSLVNALLLRPLPVAQPERIVVLVERRQDAADYSNVSRPDFVDLQEQAADVLELAAYQISQIGLSSAGRPERVMMHYVSGNFFTMLGLQPALGRLFTPAEGQALGADPVVVLAHSYWQRRFDSDASIVGRTLVANGRALTVVGVAPAGFRGPNALIEPDAYMPLGMAVIRPVSQAKPEDFWVKRDIRNLRVLGRLAPGVVLEQARSKVKVVAERLAREHADTNEGVSMHVIPEPQARPQPSTSNPLPAVAVFFLLLAATVLLVACVNVANILLAQALARRREFAVRTSLGAGRARLLRQSVTESVALALLGGAAGILLGQLACRRLESLGQHLDLPVRLDFSLDWRVFAYTFTVALVAGVAAGVLPAWRGSRTNLSEVLHEGGRGGTAGTRQRRLQQLLVVGQIAGSLVLLVVTGLLVRTLERVQRLELGFDAERVVNISMDAHLIGYDEARGRAFYDALLRAVRAQPGVESASLSHTVPFGYLHAQGEVFPEGRVFGPGETAPELYYNAVDPGYFENLRITLAAGRGFEDSDTAEHPPVAVVSEAMARRFWPNADPLGRRFSIGGASNAPIEVVGVARDAKYIEPTDEDLAYFFLPLAQHYTSYRTLQVRSGRPAESVVRELQATVHALAPDMPTWDAATMKSAMDGVNGFFVFKLGAALAATLGVLGLLLTAVGIYGVVAYNVGRRAQEIGIRMALGAQRGDILRLIVSQGLRIVGLGLGLGLLAVAAVGQLVAGFLVGVGPYDPVTLSGVMAVLVGVACAANVVPALRALRVDPLTTLRTE